MNQQSKNILLTIGFVFLAFIAYKFSFLKTYEVREQLLTIRNSISENSKKEISQQDLLVREIFLDSVIAKSNSETSLQNDILEVLNRDSKKLGYNIIAFKEPHHYISEDKIETSSLQFILEGKYEGLEKILYKLENDYAFGSLSHIRFEKKKDFRLNKAFLQCNVVIQSVR